LAHLNLDAQVDTSGPSLTNLTAEGLRNLFTTRWLNGKVSSNIIAQVVEKGDDAVGALEDLAFANADAQGASQQGQVYSLYAVRVLDIIGTSRAMVVLSRVSASHQDYEVRGFALDKIAWSYYNRMRTGSNSPNKDIIHLFLNSLQDTTFVKFKQKSIGEISREGLLNWTGLDFGKAGLGDKRFGTVHGEANKTLREFRKEWWRMNSDKLQWNPGLSKFDIKNSTLNK